MKGNLAQATITNHLLLDMVGSSLEAKVKEKLMIIQVQVHILKAMIR